MHEKKSIVVVLLQILTICVPLYAQDNPFENSSEFIANNRIDTLIIRAFRKKGIEPANLCSDAVFIRRVYLDAIGTLPEPNEVPEFLQDRNPRKLSALIHELLRREEFADYWSLKWCDLLRVKAEFPINLWPNAQSKGIGRKSHARIRKRRRPTHGNHVSYCKHELALFFRALKGGALSYIPFI